ncbi:ATP-binding protein [Anaerobacillus alkaliphilus]|uniref:ATP-binding protein n=1 Tax=Anaerobacillus alkaliphilus TaxID=1548597 RepID=A0A4Q0VPV8_9BACI|nr:ATP-binding protein [Anaerobacillus alkaliphilus]RXI96375.1 ATP-binding protein [Anaerobacillus alkaliphilus]
MDVLRHVSTFRLCNMDEYDIVIGKLESVIQSLYPEKPIYLTMVAVLEALNNSIEHGKFPITARVEQNETNKELHIEIIDSGQGFPVPEKIRVINTKGVDRLLEEKLFSTRGRGILIMYKTVKSVSFNASGNKVLLVASL